ncbi:SDR family NAD(P)-dependent oxidoreductase [Nonomuraea ferruginea]
MAATARTAASLDELVAGYGDAVLPLEMDVTDKAVVLDGVKRAAEHFGRLDVIINNAGYAQVGAVEEITEQQLRDQMETNLFGAVWVIQAALPYLREQGSGHIIQLSSAAGLMAMPLSAAYSASKWALEAVNESLAQEVADFGIKVTVIEPGGFATRGGKNPDPLDNGHLAEPDPIYDGLRRAHRRVRGKAARRRPGRRGPGPPRDRRLRRPAPAGALRPGLLPDPPAGLRRPAQDLGRLAGPFGAGSRQPRSRRSVTRGRANSSQASEPTGAPHEAPHRRPRR